MRDDIDIESEVGEHETVIKVPVTVHQQALYNSIYPQPSDKYSGLTRETQRCHFIVSGYSMILNNSDILLDQKLELFQQVVFKIMLEIPVLRTTFSRNDRILDADVECSIDKHFFFSTKYCEVNYTFMVFA